MDEGAPAPASGVYRSATAIGPAGLLSRPSYARLWTAGAIGNGMRWLELLVAGIFTWELTHSSFLVASVTVARTLPMLFLGTVAGLVADACDRKRLLLAQLCAMAANSAVLAVLAGLGAIRVWHVALGGAVAGVAWAMEMAVRRRMIGECVPAGHVREAIALDTLTGSVTRVLGPLLGGAIFDTLGIGGAYLLSALLFGGAVVIVWGLEFRQESRPLRLSRIPADIAEGVAAARASPTLLTVVWVSVIANTCGFSYSSLVAPLGLHVFGVGPLLVGLLAAAEPLGAIAGGIAVAAGWARLEGRRSMLRGTFLFFSGVVAMTLSPWYPAAFLVLCVAGLGTAGFSIMQTSLVLTEAPPVLRSRVMGIITVCIGTGPFGVLAIGALSEWLGPPAAILIMAGIGLGGLAVVRLRLG